MTPHSEVVSPRAGYIAAIDTESLGRVIIELGGGRKKLGDKLDMSVGLEMLARLGDQVDAGQPLVRVFVGPESAARVKQSILLPPPLNLATEIQLPKIVAESYT